MSENAIFEELRLARERKRTSLESLIIEAKDAVRYQHAKSFPDSPAPTHEDIDVTMFIREEDDWSMKLYLHNDMDHVYSVRYNSDVKLLQVMLVRYVAFSNVTD